MDWKGFCIVPAHGHPHAQRHERHKQGIGIEREISHNIEHVFIFLGGTKDGVAMHNSL